MNVNGQPVFNPQMMQVPPPRQPMKYHKNPQQYSSNSVRHNIADINKESKFF